MTMTKKDFEELAYTINWNSNTPEEATRTCEILREGLTKTSRLTQNGNRAFDYDKFLKAATDRWVTRETTV